MCHATVGSAGETGTRDAIQTLRGRTSTRRFNQSEPLVRDRPKGFGDKPDAYNSDAVFLMGIGAEVASMLEHVPPERRPYVRAGTPEQVANDLKP